MNITVIGLGIMGAPIARNLLAAGHDVIGMNRSPGAVERFVAAGGRTAASVAEAVAQSDVLITMLPDSPDVVAVVLDDALDHLPQGALLIDLSTIAPAVSRQLAEAGAERGVAVVDAPVSGGEQAAIDGTLSIMVGGAPAAFERARPVLEAIGTTVVHVGGAGAGQTVKAANQLIVAGTIELVAEALVFLEAHSVDLESAVRVLSGGLAGNRILDRKAAGMIAGDFAPGFRIDLHHKDLGIFSQAARDSAVVTPLGAVVAQLMASARANGDGRLDHTALLRGVRRLSGVAEG